MIEISLLSGLVRLTFYTESPQGFLDILSNPGGKYFFKYKNVNSYVINFSSFPNINYFHE